MKTWGHEGVEPDAGLVPPYDAASAWILATWGELLSAPLQSWC